jgi:hypothetical protein
VNQFTFGDHLRRQLIFLRNSCNAFDRGEQDEAIRIATVIRVLVHDSKSSVSLLTHLSAKNIHLLAITGFDAMDEPHVLAAGLVSFPSDQRSSSGIGTKVIFAKGHLLVDEWWNQTVYVAGNVRMSRRAIVLAAANKDGGAHVDKELSADYLTLINQGAGKVYDFPSGIEVPIDPAHYSYLRTMGDELLQSTGLLSLAVGNISVTSKGERIIDSQVQTRVVFGNGSEKF